MYLHTPHLAGEVESHHRGQAAIMALDISDDALSGFVAAMEARGYRHSLRQQSGEPDRVSIAATLATDAPSFLVASFVEDGRAEGLGFTTSKRAHYLERLRQSRGISWNVLESLCRDPGQGLLIAEGGKVRFTLGRVFIQRDLSAERMEGMSLDRAALALGCPGLRWLEASHPGGTLPDAGPFSVMSFRSGTLVAAAFTELTP